MAITALAFAGKSLLGSLTGKKDTPKESVKPKTPKIGPTQGPSQPVSQNQDKDKTPIGPTKAPKATVVTASSPLFKKTGNSELDKALQNVSKSLGGIKSTVVSQADFDKKKKEQAQKAKTKATRKKKERKSEKGGPIGKVLSAIGSTAKSGLGVIFRFLSNIVLGGLVLFAMENFEKIATAVGDAVNVIKDVFSFLNKYVITPMFNMVKAVAGPINTAIKALAPEKLPDFDKEKSDIEGVLGDFDIEIPIISDIIRGFNNFLISGDPRIDQEEFNEQVDERTTDTDTDGDRPVAPVDRGLPNTGTGRDGGFGTGTVGLGRPSDPKPSSPGDRGPVGGGSSGKFSGMLKFISAGEGGYNAMNQGTRGNRIVGSTQDAKSKVGKNLTDMTLGEIKQRQAYLMNSNNPQVSDYGLFAVGRYQIIPDTFPRAMKYAGLSDSDKFTPANQDKMGLGLIKGDAPAAWAYMNGKSNDINAAVNALAAVWASIPTTSGRSAYGQGNAAGHSVAEVKEALRQSRSSGSQPAQVAPRDRGPVNGSGLTDLVSRQGLDKLYGAPTGPVRTSERGMRGGRHHAGIDFGTGGQKGWYCAFKMSGKVDFVGSLSGYGKTVIINVGGYDYLFAHLAQYGVKQGDTYNGQIIGEIGNTGIGSGIHLHFEVRTKGGSNGTDVDPNPYVKYLEIGRRPSNIPTTERERDLRLSKVSSQINVDRRTSYEGNTNTTVVMPVATPTPSGAPLMYGGGGSGFMASRGPSSNTYNKGNIRNKLYS